MNIDEYINAENNTQVEEVLEVKPKVKKDTLVVSDHELIRKRDILVSVSLLDGLKSYVGENISQAKIRNMKKEKLESLFLLYQEKAGQETTNEMMTSLVEMSIKGLSYVVNIDNEEDLKNDLLNNKQLRRTIGRQATEITEKYGDGVAILRVIFDVYKHLSFSLPAPASTMPAPASTMPAPASTMPADASTMLADASTK